MIDRFIIIFGVSDALNKKYLPQKRAFKKFRKIENYDFWLGNLKTSEGMDERCH